ncbi:MAG TPA: helix-turn-helix transcriptional regulator [Pseudonocardiaceae bacterium]|nr:helix-turn-helix transcriptional regulator [Pseudonocardiaceae bacterium]
MREATSTTRGRELRSMLRGIREKTEYTGQDLARHLGWSPTKMSRIETGHQPISEVDLTAYLAYCRVPGHQMYKLLELARDAHNGYCVRGHDEPMPDQLRTLVVEETTACAIRDFELNYVPGLAQTEGYIRALLHAGGVARPAAIERWVQARVDRQNLLKGCNPPECAFYIHEQALRIPVGGAAVMHEQMLHLLFLDGRPHCSVRVVPTSAAAHGLCPSAFRIMEYADHLPVIYVETMTASLFLENKKDSDAYQLKLGMLGRVALDEGRSREFLVRLASEYDRVDEGDDEPTWSAEGDARRLAEE